MTQNNEASSAAGDQSLPADPDQSRVPDDPRRHPAETVEALEQRAQPESDRDPDGHELAEDSPPNPEDDEMEDLPGPSGGEVGEPSG